MGTEEYLQDYSKASVKVNPTDLNLAPLALKAKEIFNRRWLWAIPLFPLRLLRAH